MGKPLSPRVLQSNAKRRSWLHFWYDEEKRLLVAKQLQLNRIGYLKRVWSKDRDLKNEGFSITDNSIQAALSSCEKNYFRDQVARPFVNRNTTQRNSLQVRGKLYEIGLLYIGIN
jgi:CRISPR/Cas system-associated endonuclease Cas1